LHAHHVEFGVLPTLQEIERTVFGKVTYGW
jgi:hypothetical protein